MTPIMILQALAAGIGICAGISAIFGAFNKNWSSSDSTKRFMFIMDVVVFCICACIITITQLLS